MAKFILKHGAGTIVALTLAASVASAQTDVDLSKSTISATSKQMNVPVDGKFRKFSATVDFDPAKPSASKAQFDVDVASYDLGDEAFNKEVRGKDWFDTTAYPNATFVSTAIAAASDTYIVRGRLTIKGKTLNVVIPVHYKRDGAVQVFDGTLPIKRRQFNIGQGEWGDTSVVADDVQIKFHIVSAATK
jgi:polyisoprenoid-binding protein YceI